MSPGEVPSSSAGSTRESQQPMTIVLGDCAHASPLNLSGSTASTCAKAGVRAHWDCGRGRREGGEDGRKAVPPSWASSRGFDGVAFCEAPAAETARLPLESKEASLQLRQRLRAGRLRRSCEQRSLSTSRARARAREGEPPDSSLPPVDCAGAAPAASGHTARPHSADGLGPHRRVWERVAPPPTHTATHCPHRQVRPADAAGAPSVVADASPRAENVAAPEAGAAPASTLNAPAPAALLSSAGASAWP